MDRGPITADGSKLPIWIVPTNEELMIARDTRALVEGPKPQPTAIPTAIPKTR